MDIKVKPYIETLLSSSGRPIFLRDGIDYSSGWSDYISYFEDEYVHDAGRIDKEDNIYDSISQRLGHIVANPNNSIYTDAIVNSYVLAGGNHYVNGSEDTTAQFVNSAIKSAITQRSIAMNSKSATQDAYKSIRVYTMSGDRGCGKTFYLNYILSKYSTMLDTHNVVWVRLNLVDNFGDNSDIIHRIYAQMSKVLFRYYDTNSVEYRKKAISLNIYDNVKPKVMETDVEIRDKLLMNLEYMKAVFQRTSNDYVNNIDEPLTPELAPKILCKYIFEHALAVGYSFIVVLDGLDQLDVTIQAKAKYNKLMASAKRISLEGDHVGFPIVFVMRPRSENEFDNRAENSFNTGEVPCYKIGSVGLEKIIEKRLKCIAGNLQKTDYGFDIDYHIDGFKNHLIINNDYDELEKTFGGNRRSQMQMIQFIYYDYLRKVDRTHYRLIEKMITARHKYPPQYFSYSIDAKKKLVHINKDHSGHDSRFLPIVTCFPYIAYDTGGGSAHRPHPYGFVLGIRILQFVIASGIEKERAKQRGDVYDDCTSKDIADACHILFNYDKKVVYALIEEYAEYELISLRSTNYALPSAPDRYLVQPMVKARRIIEGFIYDIAYLNLAAMRLLLPIDIITQKPPFIMVAEYNNLYLERWTYSKIINSIAIYQMIKHANAKQIGALDMAHRKGKNLSDKMMLLHGTAIQKLDIYSFHEKMARNIDAQIRRMLSGIEATKQENVLKDISARLERYCAKWIQNQSKL